MGGCPLTTETTWARLSDEGFTPHFSISSIAKAPGMMVAEVGDRAKVKEGCEYGGGEYE
jgi:hypothetical protein